MTVVATLAKAWISAVWRRQQQAVISRTILLSLVLIAGCNADRGHDVEDSAVDGLTIAAKPTLVTNENAEESWKITGTVLSNGTPVKVKQVWAITALKDEPEGSQDYKSGTMDEDGLGFEILNIPRAIQSLMTEKPDRNLLVTVRAIVDDPQVDEQVVSQIGVQVKYEQRDVPVSAFIFLTIITALFVGNIAMGLLFRPSRDELLPLKYGLTVGLTLVFAIVMVGAFTFALYGFRTTGASESRESVSLGFATIYKGKYSEKLSDGLIFSLTEPPTIDASGLGFAAPMWVLLLSVIGSGLITVRMLVDEMEKPPFGDRGELRKRIKSFVEHQTFLLASPFVGIFVYLAVVQVIGAEPHVLAVAIAALGAGPALNSLLNRAIKASQRSITEVNEAGEGRAQAPAANVRREPDGGSSN